LTKTVRDSAMIMNAIAGHDPQETTSLNEPVPDYTEELGKDLRGARLGLAKEYMIEGIDPQVKTAIDAAVKHMDSLGAEIIDVSLPHTDYAIAVYYILATAEASANLARFDGVRYGHRAEHPRDLLDHYGRTREEGFGPEVKRRIILGTYVLSSGYYDAYYLRVQKVRELIRQDFSKVFEKADALISPTSPVPAFKFGERTADPLQMYLTDIFTCSANLAALNRRVNSPVGFRVLMSIFLVTAIAFSAAPLLHYFRGGSIRDYKLWYDTGKQLLAGEEIFVFRSGKYDFMYPPPCALFLASTSLLGQAGLILLLVAINSVAWFYSARWAAL